MTLLLCGRPHHLVVSLHCAEHFSFMESHLSAVGLNSSANGVPFRKTFPTPLRCTEFCFIFFFCRDFSWGCLDLGRMVILTVLMLLIHKHGRALYSLVFSVVKVFYLLGLLIPRYFNF